jgi:hypothetical protein
MASANLPFENEQFSNKSATNNKENSGGLQENHEHLEPLEVLHSLAQGDLSKSEMLAAKELISALNPQELEHLSQIDPDLLRSKDSKGNSIIIQLASLLRTTTTDSAQITAGKKDNSLLTAGKKDNSLSFSVEELNLLRASLLRTTTTDSAQITAGKKDNSPFSVEELNLLRVPNSLIPKALSAHDLEQTVSESRAKMNEILERLNNLTASGSIPGGTSRLEMLNPINTTRFLNTFTLKVIQPQQPSVATAQQPSVATAQQSPGAPSFISRRELLGELLLELAYPLTTTQDGHNTCVAEVMSNILFKENPGNWTAMVIDLAQGKSDRLRLPDDINDECTSRGRSAIARLVQSAISTTFAANGYEYSNLADRYYKKNGGQSFASGIYTCEAATGLGKLLGTEHSMIEDKAILRALLKAEELKFVALEWSQEENHAVMVTEVRDGRVFFRNPHGPNKENDGETIRNAGPSRKVEDRITGIESMSEDDFLEKLQSAAVPNDTLLKPEIILSLCHTADGRTALNERISFNNIEKYIPAMQQLGSQLTNEQRDELRQLSIKTAFGDKHEVGAILGLYASVGVKPLTPETRKEIITLVNRDDVKHSSQTALSYYFELLTKDTGHSHQGFSTILKEAVKKDHEATFITAAKLLDSNSPRIELSNELRSALFSGLTSNNKEIRSHALYGLRELPFFRKKCGEYRQQDRYGNVSKFIVPWNLNVPRRSGIAWSFEAVMSRVNSALGLARQ